MKYIFDLDNTIIDLHGYPSPKGKRGEKKYMNALRKLEQYSFLQGTPITGMVELVNSLYSEDVYFLTSKEERWRKSSKALLERFGIEVDSIPLIMRPNGDTRPYGRFKVDVMEKLDDTIVLFDDDPDRQLEKLLKKNRRITLLKALVK